MEPESRLDGRALHPILIVFPFGLLATSLVMDGFYLFSGDYTWTFVATWLIAGAAVSAVIPVVLWLRNWAAMPAGSDSRRIGMWHGAGNAAIMALLVANWLARRVAPGEPGAIILSLIALLCLVVTVLLGKALAGSLPDGASG